MLIVHVLLMSCFILLLYVCIYTYTYILFILGRSYHHYDGFIVAHHKPGYFRRIVSYFTESDIHGSRYLSALQLEALMLYLGKYEILLNGNIFEKGFDIGKFCKDVLAYYSHLRSIKMISVNNYEDSLETGAAYQRVC